MEEKQIKLKEAIDRGEISASKQSHRGQKRSREDDSRGQFRGRGRGRGHPFSSSTATVHPLPKKPVVEVSTKSAEYSDDEISSSGSGVDPEKDAISSKPPLELVDTLEAVANAEEVIIYSSCLTPIR